MRILFIFFIAAVLGVSSCAPDDGGFSDLEKQENEVLVKVHSNTPEAPIRVYGVGAEGGLIIKDKYERKFVTKAWSILVDARCDDPNVLIKVEIYVNGVLRRSKDGNGSVSAGVKLKGKES